jgi:DNA-binding NarL/FixJ family response regulator
MLLAKDRDVRGTRVEPTRIAFIDLPQMLREILKNVLGAQPDLRVVAEFPSDVSLTAAATRSSADVLIAGLSEAGDEDLDQVVTTYPRIKVLAIEAGGRSMFLYELRPRRVTVGEVSPERFVDLIRGFPDGVS